MKPRVVDIPTLPPLTVRPPLLTLMPPFTLIVDAFRVEGMVVPPGLYGAPLIVFTFILFVLMLNELIAAARIMFVLRMLVDMAADWISFAFTVVTFIVPVVIGAEPTFVRPPLKFMVDAFRVEGMPPPPPPGGYVAPLMLLMFILENAPNGLVTVPVGKVRLFNIVTDGLNWTVPP